MYFKQHQTSKNYMKEAVEKLKRPVNSTPHQQQQQEQQTTTPLQKEKLTIVVTNREYRPLYLNGNILCAREARIFFLFATRDSRELLLGVKMCLY